MKTTTDKLLRCVESALETQEKTPLPGFPDPEESRVAMEHALAACEQHKRVADQKVRELLKERGIIIA